MKNDKDIFSEILRAFEPLKRPEPPISDGDEVPVGWSPVLTAEDHGPNVSVMLTLTNQHSGDDCQFKLDLTGFMKLMNQCNEIDVRLDARADAGPSLKDIPF